MKIGISVTSFYAVEDPREGARRMIDRARAASAAGLDSLFVGDHHATPRPYYQNSPILGRLLAEWGDRPFGALYLLPLWHPVLLAEQVGTLAALASGRFILQCAVGPADRQFQAMGVEPRHRPSRFEESLDLLRRLWAGEEVTADGRWSFEQARISPCPAEPVEVWIGASADPAIDRAARLGDAWLAAPGLSLDQARRQLDVYREACERHRGRGGRATIRRDIYVGESAAEAESVAAPIVAAGYRGFPPDAPICGDADRVAEAFAELEEIGYEHVVVRNLVSEPSRALESIDRLAAVRRRLTA